MEKKNIPLSYCRVIAMLFIVLCHIVKYYTMIPLHQYMSEFFRVGVEIFIILSGYLYGSRQITDYKKFYLRRYVKICLPVQIWTIIVFIIWHGIGDVWTFIVYFFNLGGINWIKKDLLPPYGVNGMGALLNHTWFVTIIVICYLLIPLMQKIRSRVKKEIAFYGLLTFWIVSIIAAFNGIQIYYFALYLSAYFAAYYEIRLPKFRGGGIACGIIYTVLIFVLILGRVPLHLDAEHAAFYDNVYVHISQSLFAVWIIITIYILYKYLKKYMDFISGTWLFIWLERLAYSIYIVHGSFRQIIYEKYDIGLASIIFCVMTICSALLLYWGSEVLEKILLKKLGRIRK